MQDFPQTAQRPARRSRCCQSRLTSSACQSLSGNDKLPPPSGGMRVCRALLADGNEMFRAFLRDILVRHFPSMLVAEAADGDSALALDAELQPHLVFIDFKLPDCSGLDLGRQFKLSNPEVLICLVTQHDIPEYRVAARECGADHVIVMGESGEAAIVAMVEATLSGCRRTRRPAATDDRHSQEECISGLSG